MTRAIVPIVFGVLEVFQRNDLGGSKTELRDLLLSGVLRRTAILIEVIQFDKFVNTNFPVSIDLNGVIRINNKWMLIKKK